MNTKQLEAKSELERDAVQNTIGELRRRLSPGQLVDEFLAYTNDGGGEFISNLGRQATNNPLPVTLIGAGLAWFLFSQGGSKPSEQNVSRSATSRSSAENSSSYSGSAHMAAASEAGLTAVDAVSHGVSAVTDGVSEGFAAARETLSSAGQSLQKILRSGVPR